MSVSNPTEVVRLRLPVQMALLGMTMDKKHKSQHDFFIKEWEKPLYADLRKLFSFNNVREVLTHSSFYEKEDKGNSRFVFAGMFVFKGMVADVLFRYATGEGTQLQHILGNLFRNERLARLFDEWQLDQYVRTGEKFDIDSHKHVFVYAVFGYVTTLDENIRHWFIAKYILNEESDYLFAHKRRNRDLLAQADALVKQTNGQRLSFVMEMTDDGLHRAKAVVSDGTVLCEATSKSWRYARTKATKAALNLLATPFRKELLANPDYQARVAAREEEKRAKRKAEVEARDVAKVAQRAEKEKKQKEEARLRDAKRRKAQAEAKKRKTEHAARAAAKAAKEAQPMSAKKRRYLEDKRK